MIQELAQEILKGTSVGTVEDSVTVHSAPPILQTRLRAAEVSASVLSAQAMLINHTLWHVPFQPPRLRHCRAQIED